MSSRPISCPQSQQQSRFGYVEGPVWVEDANKLKVMTLCIPPQTCSYDWAFDLSAVHIHTDHEQ